MKFDCQVMRRKLVKSYKFNFVTGEETDASKEWRTEPCGNPLRSREEREAETCKSCASGWTHKHNCPVKGEEGGEGE